MSAPRCPARSPLLLAAAVILSLLATNLPLTAQPLEAGIAYLDSLIASASGPGDEVLMGHTMVSVEALKSMRNGLAQEAGLPVPKSATDDGVLTWPGGVVYYWFDTSVTSDSLADQKMKAFRDAAAEWALFADLTFIEQQGATPGDPYSLVTSSGPEGGTSTLGMRSPASVIVNGPAQTFRIGPNSWNRHTLCHELGHTLGLIHEHQRSDRNTYVWVDPNRASSDPGNFGLVASSINMSAYDFLSVMHYHRDSGSPNVDVIVPNAPYMEFIDQMGTQYDRVISAGDREGIVDLYGASPTPLSPVVTKTDDCGPGSLRAAIYYAITNPGTTIEFDIPAEIGNPFYSAATDSYTIQPSGSMTRPGPGTVLDATTQQEAVADAHPEIILNGAFGTNFVRDGIRVTDDNILIKGLTINGFPESGIHFESADAHSNQVAGCYLGTNATGTAAVPNATTFGAGAEISAGAHENLVGGDAVDERNLISGNTYYGVRIHGASTSYNHVTGNNIGVNAAGSGTLPNASQGVRLDLGCTENVIGGTTAGERNVISGNGSYGVVLQDTGTIGNVIQGNYIGLNAAGTSALANDQFGVAAFSGPDGTVIGGFVPGAGNVISGHSEIGDSGVYLQDCDDNVVAGNFIGLNSTGTAAIPNRVGVSMFNSDGNHIGGTTAAERNVVSGNGTYGIYISTSEENTVTGNYVGLNSGGTAAIANPVGVALFSSSSNHIGGTTAGERNVISGNSNYGIYIATSTGNTVTGNYVGLNPAGTAAIGNPTGFGVFGGTDTRIGGPLRGEGNVISGHTSSGIRLGNSDAIIPQDTVIQGNYMGLTADGLTGISSGESLVMSGGNNTLIGGTETGAGNVLTASNGVAFSALYISGATCTNTTIQGNVIGTNATGQTVVGITNAIYFTASATGALVGGSAIGAANLMRGTDDIGVRIAGGSGITVSRNSIYDYSFTSIYLDPGANGNQPPPTLSSAVLTTVTTINGSLSGFAANTNFTIEFFAHSVSSGRPTRQFLGAATVMTNGSGAATFSQPLNAIAPKNSYIRATATHTGNGNTSEPSTAVVQVTATDGDGDSLPAAYEALYSDILSDANAADAALDSDGDGQTNSEEFQAGTNPDSGSERVGLAAVWNSTDKICDLQLPTMNGRVYNISRQPILGGTWHPLLVNILGTGSPITIPDESSFGVPLFYYRAGVGE